MKRFLSLTFAVALASNTLIGCTTHLADGQKRELEVYESKGLLVQEKSPGLAAALGVLPAAGYIYTGHPFIGIASIPLWVISLGPLWMPYDSASAATSKNYYATRMEVERRKAKALRELDHRLEDKELTYEQHLREQRSIEAKYSAY